jgi:hypothetical protein
MTINTYETLDGDTIPYDVADCQSVADYVMAEMVDAHSYEGNDFYIISQMVIQNVLGYLQSVGSMSDDATLDFMLEFIKKGEVH